MPTLKAELEIPREDMTLGYYAKDLVFYFKTSEMLLRIFEVKTHDPIKMLRSFWLL